MNPSTLRKLVEDVLVRHHLTHALPNTSGEITKRLLKASKSMADEGQDSAVGLLYVTDFAAKRLAEELAYWNRVLCRSDSDHSLKRPRNWRAPVLPEVFEPLAVPEEPDVTTALMASNYSDLVWSTLQFCCDLYLYIDELQGYSGPFITVTDSDGLNRLVCLGKTGSAEGFRKQLKKAENLAEKLDDSNPLDAVVFQHLARQGYRSVRTQGHYLLRHAPLL